MIVSYCCPIVSSIIESSLNFLINCQPTIFSFCFFFTLHLGFQDLKNLRAQLYSAAEYFEVSYTNDDQKQMCVSPICYYGLLIFPQGI